MSTVHEFSADLGSYATLLGLDQAVHEAMASFNHYSRVSFRERGKALTLVARWEIRFCDFADAGCDRDVTRIGDEGGEFCDRHGEANYPDYDDALEGGVTCEAIDCPEPSTFKEPSADEGNRNRCDKHAPQFINAVD